MRAIVDVIQELRENSNRPRKNTVLHNIVQSAWEFNEDSDLDTNDNPFDEEDSPDNLVFLDPKELETSESSAKNSNPPAALIKAATLSKLVERATPAEYVDTDYVTDFLLT